ncbi:HNH endonuclease [Mesorhizobium sp. Z1-4]|uniref:HNH endonuclease n=1 Tax=Mesorhizobium sp. Z1-4 TaxID=2448478 RepID=UPI000FDBEE6A|nr:HNH endonuclease [Mesorhizobium sp. Z1-4]
MTRPVPEWIAKHDGQNIPPRVRQRVYDRDNGKCHLCKLPIKVAESWQADHVRAMINGGEHRESNLAPVHARCHVSKTARDVAEKSKTARIRQKHTGAIRPKQKIPGRGFGLSAHKAKREARATQSLPPKRLFAQPRSIKEME